MLCTSTATAGCSALTRFTSSTASVSGMLMSVSSTSTGVLFSFSRTSEPFAASAAITMSGDIAKMWLSPRRTTEWSSATSMRIGFIALERYRHGHLGPLPGDAADVQGPVQHDDALADAEQAEGLLPAGGLDVEAAPVVLDVQPDVGGVAPQADLDVAGIRVPGDVRQRLLEYPEQHDAACLLEVDLPVLDLDLAADAAALLEFVDQPFDPGEDSEVERRGPQRGRDVAHQLDDVVDASFEALDLLRRLGRRLRGLQADDRQVHLERGERLSHLVVDLARDVGALLLADRLVVRRQLAQQLLMLAQALLRVLARGDIDSLEHHELSPLEIDQRRGREDVAHLPVLAPQADLAGVHRLVPLHVRDEALPFLGVGPESQRDRALAYHLPGRVAAQPLGGGVDQHEGPVLDARDGDRLRASLDHLGEALLRLLQQPLRAAPLRDVADHREQHGFALEVDPRGPRQQVSLPARRVGHGVLVLAYAARSHGRERHHGLVLEHVAPDPEIGDRPADDVVALAVQDAQHGVIRLDDTPVRRGGDHDPV